MEKSDLQRHCFQRKQNVLQHTESGVSSTKLASANAVRSKTNNLRVFEVGVRGRDFLQKVSPPENILARPSKLTSAAADVPFVVIGKVFACFDSAPPGFMFQVPAYGLVHSVFKGHARAPGEFLL